MSVPAAKARAAEDFHIVGELLHCMRCFGLTEEDWPMLADGCAWLLKKQNANGSWGDAQNELVYNVYHATNVCMHGLLCSDFRGCGP